MKRSEGRGRLLIEGIKVGTQSQLKGCLSSQHDNNNDQVTIISPKDSNSSFRSALDPFIVLISPLYH